MVRRAVPEKEKLSALFAHLHYLSFFASGRKAPDPVATIP
jgi:hypothetical protein